MTVPDSAVEAAARKLAALNGLDPDKPKPDYHLTWPAWRLFEKEAREAITTALPHLGVPIAYAWVEDGKLVNSTAYPRSGGNATTPLYLAPPAPAADHNKIGLVEAARDLLAARSDSHQLVGYRSDLWDRLAFILSVLVEQPAPAIPEGWKAVPVDPTVEMQNAAVDTHPFELGDIAGLGLRMSPQRLFTQCYAAMLAAAPEPPANSQGSLDGSAEPMMTDEEIAEFIKENGQPEDTFPYLRVPLTPAADPVKARLVEALRRARDEIRRYSYIESATSKAFIDDYNERMVPIDAAIAAAEAEENTNKG